MKWCCKKRKKKIGFGFVTLLAVVHHTQNPKVFQNLWNTSPKTLISKLDKLPKTRPEFAPSRARTPRRLGYNLQWCRCDTADSLQLVPTRIRRKASVLPSQNLSSLHLQTFPWRNPRTEIRCVHFETLSDPRQR